MLADTEELLEWASRKMGVRFRDPGERRQQALTGLVDSGFAPEAPIFSAISILLHYETGEPLVAPFLTPLDLQEIERDRLREKVIAELHTLPDLPLDQRIVAYHQLRQEAARDPWLLQRVYRTAALIVGHVGHIEPGDPLRWLVLLPSEAVLKRPAPPPSPAQSDTFRFLEDEAHVSPSETQPKTQKTTNSGRSAVGIGTAVAAIFLALRIVIMTSTMSHEPRPSYPTQGSKAHNAESVERMIQEIERAQYRNKPPQNQLRPTRPARRVRPALSDDDLFEFPSMPVLPNSPAPKSNDLPPPL